MNVTKLLLGTLIGGIVLFFAGWLIWGFLMAGIQADHRTTIDGIYKTEPDIILIFLSCLTGGGLLSLIFHRWAGIKTWLTGAKAGAVVMILYGLMAELAIIAEFDIFDMSYVLFNIPAYLLWGAIGGAAVGGYLGYGE